MRSVLSLLFILLIATAIGYFISQDQGYVLIAYRHWTIETSLWFFVAVLIIVFLLLRVILFLLRSPAQACHRLQLWLGKKSTQRIFSRTDKGVQKLAEGQWPAAIQSLRKAAEDNQFPLLNYLVAAFAANLANQTTERDHLLQLAKQHSHEELPVLLTQGALLLQNHEYEQAEACLQRALSLSPNNMLANVLLYSLYNNENAWGACAQLMPDLKKAWSSQRWIQENEHVFTQLFSSAATIEDLQHYWNLLPRQLRKNTTITSAYTEQQNRLQQ